MYRKRFTPRCFPSVKEIVDQTIYELIGEEAWKLFDIRLFLTIDTLCELQPNWSIVCNTWSFKNWSSFGAKKWVDRGYRSLKSTTGATLGAHFRGMALDFDVYDKTTKRLVQAVEVRKFILANIDKFEFIRCIEVAINWNHIDVMDSDDFPEKRGAITRDKILLVWPKEFNYKVEVVKRNELAGYINKGL
jgi:hypothetical protein